MEIKNIDLFKNKTVVLGVGTSCHVKCKFCYKEYYRNKKNYFHPIDEMKEKIKKLAKTASHVLLVGGEPTVYPQIEELLLELKKYNITATLVSIGDKFSDKDFLNKILKIGVIKSIHLGIHTLDYSKELELYGKEGIIDKQLAGVNNLINSKFNNVNFGVNIVMTSVNRGTIGNTILELNLRGIDIFYISAMHMYGGITKRNIECLTPYLSIKKELDVLYNKIKSGDIRLALKGFPLCIHKYFRKYLYEIKELNIKEYNKVNLHGVKSGVQKSLYKKGIDECEGCYAYNKTCSGPYEYYTNLFGVREFKALNKIDFESLVDTNMGNVWTSIKKTK